MNKRVWFILATLGIALGGVAVWFTTRSQPAEQIINPPPETVVVSEDEPTLVPTVILANLTNVWDVGFLPNRTMLFTERAGTISKLEEGKKVIIHDVSDVLARGEGGLMGLAIDPGFENNRFIYACYNTPDDIRVSRWKVNNDVSGLTDQVDIVMGMPVNKTTFPGRHSGCRPRFGADGNLWIGTGDVAIGTNPQDPKSLGGKILRVTREGLPVKGNAEPPFDPRVYSYGHRNTQGLAMFDSVKNGSYGFSVEHGTARDDEVNQLIMGNFGYNPVPGYNEAVDMTDIEKYPGAVGAVWSSGTPTIAPSGATILTGLNWKRYNGALAMAVLKDKYVHVFTLDQTGKITGEKPFFINEFGRIRSVVMGPNNKLYITTDNGNGEDVIVEVATQ